MCDNLQYYLFILKYPQTVTVSYIFAAEFHLFLRDPAINYKDSHIPRVIAKKLVLVGYDYSLVIAHLCFITVLPQKNMADKLRVPISRISLSFLQILPLLYAKTLETYSNKLYTSSCLVLYILSNSVSIKRTSIYVID